MIYHLFDKKVLLLELILNVYGRFEIDEFIIQVFSDESRWTYIKVDKDNLKLIHKGKNY